MINLVEWKKEKRQLQILVTLNKIGTEGIREISRITGITPKTVKLHLDFYLTKDWVYKVQQGAFERFQIAQPGIDRYEKLCKTCDMEEITTENNRFERPEDYDIPNSPRHVFTIKDNSSKIAHSASSIEYIISSDVKLTEEQRKIIEGKIRERVKPITSETFRGIKEINDVTIIIHTKKKA